MLHDVYWSMILILCSFRGLAAKILSMISFKSILKWIFFKLKLLKVHQTQLHSWKYFSADSISPSQFWAQLVPFSSENLLKLFVLIKKSNCSTFSFCTLLQYLIADSRILFSTPFYERLAFFLFWVGLGTNRIFHSKLLCCKFL